MTSPLKASHSQEGPYFDWCVQTSEVTLGGNIYVSNSDVEDPNSGEGLFIENKRDEVNNQEILLRIPKKNTFTEDTIRSLLLRKELYSDDSDKSDVEEFNDRLRSTVGEICCELGEELMTETVALTAFFIGFNIHGYRCPDMFSEYLHKVLLHTEVNVPITRPDIFLGTYGHYPDLRVNETVVKRINNALTYEDTDCYGEVRKNIRQIYAAVVSRALEIPVEMSAGSEDYYIDITLVPILDFVNHSTANPTCYFDVDRATNDIILKRIDNQDNHTKKDKEELFIQYYDTVEYTKSTFVYGFIPEIRNDQTAFFNLSLERDFIPSYIRVFYKWFGINPMVQFYKDGQHGEWQVHSNIDNFIDILLPFMVDSSLEGSDIWLYNRQAFKSVGNLRAMISGKATDEIQASTDKFQVYIGERNTDDVIRFAQLAWTLKFKDEHNELKKRRPTKEQAREHYKNLSAIDKIKTYQKFKDFFNDYSTKRLWHLEKSVVDITGSFAVLPYKKDQCESFLNLCNSEIQLLEQMKSRGIEKAIEYNESLKQKLSSYPPIPFAYCSSGIEKEIKKILDSFDITEETSEITDDESHEEDFTDFLQDEVDSSSAYFRFSMFDF